MEGGQLLGLCEAVRRLLPKQPNPATLWRWHARGVRGIVLETVLVGGRRYVTREALERFIDAVTEAGNRKIESSAADTGDTTIRRSPETLRRLREEKLLDEPRRKRSAKRQAPRVGHPR